MGLSEGCILKRDLPMDAAITFADVEIPKGRLSDKLFADQSKRFGLAKNRSSAAEDVARVSQWRHVSI